MMESHEPFWAPSISNSPAQGNPTSHFRDFAYVPKSSGGTGSGGGSLAAISGVGSGSGSGGTSVYNNTARFPSKLHAMLSDLEIQGLSHIVSWQPHGRCFLVHRPDDFVKDVLSSWFRQTSISSFQRQLNSYGFLRIKTGADKSAYFHEFFLRGKPSLVDCIRAVKNDSLRKISAPNFYKLPFLPPSIIPRVCGPESSIQYQPQQKQLSTTPFSLRPGSSDRDRSNEMRSMDASAALERASRLQTWAKPTSNLVGLIPVAATNFDQLRSLAPQSVEGAAVMNTINTSSSSLLRENGLVTPEGFTRRDVHRALVSEFVMNNLPREQICRSRSDTADPSSYPPPTQPASMSAPQMQQVRAANNLLFHPGTSTTALYGRLGGPTSLSLTVAMDPKGQTGTTTTTTAREFELLRLQASMMLGGNAIKRSPAIALNSMQLLPINNFNDRTSQGCSILENAIDSGSMDLALQLCQEKLDSMDTASRNWLLQQIRRGQ